MIGHTSKVLLGVGMALCVTLYWTQSRLSASAPPGPQPEIQPQFATLGGGVLSSMPVPDAAHDSRHKQKETKAAPALRPADHKAERRAKRKAQTMKEASSEELEQLLDVGMLAPGATVVDQDKVEEEGQEEEEEDVEEEQEEEDTSVSRWTDVRWSTPLSTYITILYLLRAFPIHSTALRPWIAVPSRYTYAYIIHTNRRISPRP